MTAYPPPGDVIVALERACGPAQVFRDHDARLMAAHDAHDVGEIPLVLVRPKTRADAAAAVAVATAHGLAVLPRGGGMSYTDAYRSSTARAMLLDTSGLDRILAIDARALWATVEAGCTWAALDAALALQGVRARFWGPMSGHHATVGGSLSNGTATFGSGAAGTSGANVLGVEVALADGRIVRTGMDAQNGHLPFFDDYGPRLTGLFANDAGAFGVKLAVTLPLEPRPARVEGLSFVFGSFDALAEALERIARASLASEAFAMEAAVAAQFAAEGSLKADLAMLARIARGPGGLRRALRAGLGGRSFLKQPGFHAHVVVEGRDARDVRAKLALVRNMAAAGREIANTVPSAIRAAPFSPLPLTDPGGRRVLPIQGIVPYAAAGALHEAVATVIERHRAAARAAAVTIATTVFAIGRGALLYEPVFYWEDALTPYQARRAGSAVRHTDNPAARALIETMRAEMVEAMFSLGAAHLQIGRRYPYLRERDAALLRGLKALVDPANLMNPGALGL